MCQPTWLLLRTADEEKDVLEVTAKGVDAEEYVSKEEPADETGLAEEEYAKFMLQLIYHYI